MVTKHAIILEDTFGKGAVMAIKELLREEFENSLRLERDYVLALGKLPRGSLVKKLVRGRAYYYLASREAGRVQFRYIGKNMKEEEISRYQEAKRLRILYRGLLSQARHQIKFLRKALRGNKAI